MSKETGGPVYPCRIPTGELHANGDSAPTRQHYGMTLRDYFAANAMQAMMSDTTVLATMSSGPKGPSDELAESAYSMADAMLRARGQA